MADTWLDEDLVPSIRPKQTKKRTKLILDDEPDPPSKKNRLRESKKIETINFQETTLVSDLVVNKVKIKEVEDIFIHPEMASKCITVIYGPSGCGKTTTIKCLANKFNFDVVIWKDSDPLDYDSCIQFEVSYTSKSNSFKSFLKTALIFNPLDVIPNQSKRNNKIILAELDSHLVTNFQSYVWNAIKSLQSCMNVPVILEFTTSSNENFYPGHLKSVETKIRLINFNPLTQKALEKLAHRLVRTKSKNAKPTVRLSDEEICSICAICEGDARKLIHSLAFASIPCDPSKQSTNPLQICMEIPQYKFDLFHTVGKILYAKREANCSDQDLLPHHLKHYSRSALKANLMELLETVSPHFFNMIISFLQHNVPSFSKNVQSIHLIFEDLAELHSNSFFSTEKNIEEWNRLELMISASSSSFYLTSDSSSRTFRQIQGSKNLEYSKKTRENMQLLRKSFPNELMHHSLVTLNLPYLKLIKPHKVESFHQILNYSLPNEGNPVIYHKPLRRSLPKDHSQIEMSMSDDAIEELLNDSDWSNFENALVSNTNESATKNAPDEPSYDISSFSSDDDDDDDEI